MSFNHAWAEGVWRAKPVWLVLFHVSNYYPLRVSTQLTKHSLHLVTATQFVDELALKGTDICI